MGYGRGVGVGVNVLSKYCQGMQPQHLVGYIQGEGKGDSGYVRVGYGRGVGIEVNVLSKYCQGMQPQHLVGYIHRVMVRATVVT